MNYQSRQAGSAIRPGPAFVLLLVVISAISSLALNIFVPSMPGMQQVFETDYTTIQLTLSLYFAGIALGQPVIGPLSDRFGRRPVLLVGYGLFVASSAVCAAAPTIEVLIAGRIVQAASGCAGLVLARAVVRDIYERDQAASMIGYVTMGMAVAPMVAPAIGGAIDILVGWRAVFIFVGLAGLTILGLAACFLPETNHNRITLSRSSLIGGYGALLGSPSFWGHTLVVAFSSLCFFAFLSGSSYVMSDIMGRSPAEYGLYFPLGGIGYIAGNFCSGRLVTRVGTSRMMTFGILITATGVVTMAIAFGLGSNHPLALFAPTLFVGIGNGMTLPSGMAGALSIRPDLAGAASGLTGMVQMGAGALIGPILGAVLDETVWPMVAAMAVAVTLSLIARLFIATPRGRPPPV